MKNIITLFLFIISINEICIAQKVDTIKVSYNKTIMLLYDSEIKFDDVGIPDIALDRQGNKLRLKTRVRYTPETSLFIETASGYYQYILVYDDNPKKLLYNYSSENSNVKIIRNEDNEEELEEEPVKVKDIKTKISKKNKDPLVASYERDCYAISKTENTTTGLGIIQKKIFFFLGDMYVKDDLMYFKLVIRNTSNIRMDVDLVRFVIRGKKGPVKGAAVQENLLESKYIFNDEVNTVAPKGIDSDRIIKVFVFEKFTIDSDKLLHIELWEKGGDRIMDFSITANELLKIKRF